MKGSKKLNIHVYGLFVIDLTLNIYIISWMLKVKVQVYIKICKMDRPHECAFSFWFYLIQFLKKETAEDGMAGWQSKFQNLNEKVNQG